ncbi:MAG: transporter substrate-binding domain-containing protein [Brevinematales bacterium]
MLKQCNKTFILTLKIVQAGLIASGLFLFSISFPQVNNKIIVLADDKYPPYFFRDDKGKLQGIAADQWKLWSEKTGIKVDLQAMDWDEAQRLMAAGKADCIDNFFYNEKRAKLYDFSKPYENIEVPVFFNRNISGIHDIKSLSGYIIGVKSGDADIDILKSKGISNLMEFNSYESIIRAASNNLINVFCIDKPSALYYLYKMNIAGQYRYSFTLSTEQLHRAVQKGRTKLLNIIEKGFSEIPESKYMEIKRKWLGNDLNNNNIIYYLYYSLALILLVILVFSSWNYTLRKTINKKTKEIMKTMEEKNKINEKLVESRLMYKNIFENAPIGIFQSTVEGKFLSVNSLLACIFKYESAEDMVRSITDIAGQLFVNPMARKELLKKVLKTDRYIQTEVEYYRKDKTTFTANLYMRAVRDADSSVCFVEGFVEDITERNIAWNALKESEKRLSEIIDFLPDATFVIDFNGVVIAWNRAIEEMTGVKAASILGKGDYEYSLSFYGARRPILIDQVFNINEEIEEEYNYIKKEGDAFIAEADIKLNGNNHVFWTKVVPLFDSKGGLTGAIETIRDITDQKKAEKKILRLNSDLEHRIARRTAELEIAMEKAQDADRLKSAFLATMSHELRTPLNSIIGFTGILLQERPGPLNQEQKKQMEMVQQSSRHLLSLINDILDISKIEAGELKINSETFNLPEVINKTVGLNEPLAQKKGIKLNISIAPEIDTIKRDRLRVQQILMNLVNNSIKFTEKGSVTIKCFLIKKFVTVEVIDTGIGIEKDKIDRLFKPFIQIDNGLTRKYEGTGLGLSICKKLLELLNGSIEVRSKFGSGSVFSISLPV